VSNGFVLCHCIYSVSDQLAGFGGNKGIHQWQALSTSLQNAPPARMCVVCQSYLPINFVPRDPPLHGLLREEGPVGQKNWERTPPRHSCCIIPYHTYGEFPFPPYGRVPYHPYGKEPWSDADPWRCLPKIEKWAPSHISSLAGHTGDSYKMTTPPHRTSHPTIPYQLPSANLNSPLHLFPHALASTLRQLEEI